MSVTLIKRSSILPYSARQMYELVDAIEDYPRFLPWCHSTQIVSRDAQSVEATLNLVWSGVHKSFTTRNILSPYSRIDINLVKGPFRHLEGIWSFVSMGEGCKVDLELEFELIGHFLDRFFHPIFHHMANSLVELFTKRAIEVYGNRKED